MGEATLEEVIIYSLNYEGGKGTNSGMIEVNFAGLQIGIVGSYDI